MVSSKGIDSRNSRVVDISVIYVNYNTQALLEASLRSLTGNVAGISYEVIVVDNKSKNFDSTSIKKILPSVKVMQQNENLGFGQGNNAGAKIAKGKYLWLLNTDTLIPANSNLGVLIEYMHTHADCAAATPLLVNEQDVQQAAQVGSFPAVWRMLAEKLAKLVVRSLPFTRSTFGSLSPGYVPPAQCNVQQAVAASLFVRKDDFEEVGGFSKEYFFFLEDTDLCKKLALNGKKIRFIPEARVVHLHGRSISSQIDRRKKYYSGQDIYFKKWKSLPAQYCVKVMRLPILLMYWLKHRNSRYGSPDIHNG